MADEPREPEVLDVSDHNPEALVPHRGSEIARPEDLLPGTPAERLAHAVEVSNTLAPVIRDKGLYKRIGDKDYVLYEGWTLLGGLVGVFPVTVWSRPVTEIPKFWEDAPDYGWEARIEARRMDGSVVGAAEAQCTRDEKLWRGRDAYALRSMAQTRAGAKAMRMALGFIMQLSGFEATPADEMPSEPNGVTAEGGRREPQSARGEGTTRKPGSPPRRSNAPASSGNAISEKQAKYAWALAHERAETLDGVEATDIMNEVVRIKFEYPHTKEIQRRDFDAVLESIKNWEPPTDG